MLSPLKEPVRVFCCCWMLLRNILLRTFAAPTVLLPARSMCPGASFQSKYSLIPLQRLDDCLAYQMRVNCANYFHLANSYGQHKMNTALQRLLVTL